MNILVINGPNLNFLGIREKEIYGSADYAQLTETIRAHAASLGVSVEIFQSHHEGAIIDRIQEAYRDSTDAIIINPGAYTHYSYAIHDALKSIGDIPRIEVHLSDIRNREPFRAVSVTAPACAMQISGKGFDGYLEAMDLLVKGL